MLGQRARPVRAGGHWKRSRTPRKPRQWPTGAAKKCQTNVFSRRYSNTWQTCLHRLWTVGFTESAIHLADHLVKLVDRIAHPSHRPAHPLRHDPGRVQRRHGLVHVDPEPRNPSCGGSPATAAGRGGGRVSLRLVDLAQPAAQHRRRLVHAAVAVQYARGERARHLPVQRAAETLAPGRRRRQG
jgi:hypothetical protein